MKKFKQFTAQITAACCLLLCTGSTAWSMQATVSHTIFYQQQAPGNYDANVTLCWRALNSSLHFKKDSAGILSSSLVILLRISNDSGTVKEETMVWKTPAISDPGKALNQLIMDQYTYTLSPGRYEAELVLFEPDYKNQPYEYSDTFRVNAPKSTPFISGIQLLDTAFRSPTQTALSRNGIVLLPLASDYLSEKHDSVRYYLEAYNLDKAKPEQLPLKLSTFISWSPYASAFPSLTRTDTPGKTVSVPYLGAFRADILKSGNYYLNATLTDQNNKVLDRQCIFMQRYNPNPKKTDEVAVAVTPADKDTLAVNSNDPAHIFDLTVTFVGKYTAAQVREVLKMINLIATPDEAQAISGFLRKPEELYSKYFIYNFWESRNKKDPAGAWKAYTERIREVNRLFGKGGRPGYATDRGRLYIQYGKPNDRIQVPNEAGALPYELWQYYRIEKTGRDAIFLLYRSSSSVGDYELLHSTMVGEKRNTNWRALLYSNGITNAGGVNPDSQAEQYIGNK